MDIEQKLERMYAALRDRFEAAYKALNVMPKR
jgi:hypothetical protein